MSYKKLSNFQANDKTFIPLTKFAIKDPKEADRLIKIVTPNAIAEMILFNLRGKNE